MYWKLIVVLSLEGQCDERIWHQGVCAQLYGCPLHYTVFTPGYIITYMYPDLTTKCYKELRKQEAVRGLIDKLTNSFENPFSM